MELSLEDGMVLGLDWDRLGARPRWWAVNRV